MRWRDDAFANRFRVTLTFDASVWQHKIQKKFNVKRYDMLRKKI